MTESSHHGSYEPSADLRVLSREAEVSRFQCDLQKAGYVVTPSAVPGHSASPAPAAALPRSEARRHMPCFFSPDAARVSAGGSPGSREVDVRSTRGICRVSEAGFAADAVNTALEVGPQVQNLLAMTEARTRKVRVALRWRSPGLRTDTIHCPISRS